MPDIARPNFIILVDLFAANFSWSYFKVRETWVGKLHKMAITCGSSIIEFFSLFNYKKVFSFKFTSTMRLADDNEERYAL